MELGSMEFIILKIIAGILLIAFIGFCIKNIKKEKEFMSFREAIDLVGIPVVTFIVEGHKLHFILDTGANKSVLNKKIADKLNTTKEGKAQVIGIEGAAKYGYHTTVSLEYKEKFYQERFQVIDLTDSFKEIKKKSGVTLHGILGSSFMEKYKYVLDFKEMIAYSKK